MDIINNLILKNFKVSVMGFEPTAPTCMATESPATVTTQLLELDDRFTLHEPPPHIQTLTLPHTNYTHITRR